MINWDTVRGAFVEKYDVLLVNAGRAFDEWRKGLEWDPETAYAQGQEEGYDAGFREGYDAGYEDGEEDAVG